MKKEKYAVTGMTCSACSSHVEKSVSKLQGVDEVSVNLLTNSMQVAYDEGACNIQMISNHSYLNLFLIHVILSKLNCSLLVSLISNIYFIFFSA